MSKIERRQIPGGKTVGEALEAARNDVAVETLERIHILMSESVKRLQKEMADLGAEVEDEHGAKIPQAVSDRDKIMFKAGEQSLALFIMGVTLSYRK